MTCSLSASWRRVLSSEKERVCPRTRNTITASRAKMHAAMRYFSERIGSQRMVTLGERGLVPGPDVAAHRLVVCVLRRCERNEETLVEHALPFLGAVPVENGLEQDVAVLLGNPLVHDEQRRRAGLRPEQDAKPVFQLLFLSEVK